MLGVICSVLLLLPKHLPVGLGLNSRITLGRLRVDHELSGSQGKRELKWNRHFLPVFSTL